MADTTLMQTGAEVQADLNKVEGLANIKTIGSGLSLSAGGELSANGSSIKGYTVTLGTSYANHYSITWLDSSLIPHSIVLDGTTNINNTPLTDVYKIRTFVASRWVNNHAEDEPNYIYANKTNTVATVKDNSVWGSNTGVAYMGTTNYDSAFTNSYSDEKDWYILADVTIDVAFVGGGAGN